MRGEAQNYGRESRVKKTFLNVRISLIFYFLTLIITFFTRKIFLDTLGASFMGLTSTLSNLLGFLNLAELGIASAIGFLLYKPLYDRDENKISEIISVMGYLYKWIGLIIFGGGCILACFIPLIFPEKDTDFSYGIIYFAYFSFLFSSLIGYFINYRANLLGADQRMYVVTAYFQANSLIKTLIQVYLAYYYCNYYLWLSIEMLFGLINAIILNYKVRKTYPWLKASVARGKSVFKTYPEVMKKTKQLFFHKIGSFIQFQTTPFLIYAFVSLEIVAYYANYTIIIDRVGALLSNVLNSTGASVGNLIAEGNKEKIMGVYWEMFSLRMYVAGFVSWSLFFLTPSFIGLWLGSEYILPQGVLILLCINQFIMYNRGCTEQFVGGYGLWWDIWAPLIESVIYIVIAIIGGYFYGLTGVLLGPTISVFLLHVLWKPYLLFRWGFRLNAMVYWSSYIKYTIMTFCGAISIYIINGFTLVLNADGWLNWIIYAIKSCGIYIIITYLLFILLSKGMRDLTNRFIKIKIRKS